MDSRVARLSPRGGDGAVSQSDEASLVRERTAIGTVSDNDLEDLQK